jgi:cobyrinic acid a,c-diamide synthase
MGGRLMIAGTQSGVGKTTITVGLISALRKRGLTVQPFKVGPDYIDPTYHTLAAGRACRNLDTWMVPPDRVKSLFARAATTADLAIIEGVMGLHDGAGYEDDSGSPAELAKLLGIPVVLVLDAAKAARSVAAFALGFKHFDKDVPIAGFIINRVAGEHHGQGVAAAVEKATGLPVLGWLPRLSDLHVPERHLGLIPTVEPGTWLEFARAAGEAVCKYLNLDRLLTLTCSDSIEDQQAVPFLMVGSAQCSPVIAVARDEAFHFIYEDNLDLLCEAGAKVVYFSPLDDDRLPVGTAGIILAGGFPEIFAERLSANRAMHAALRLAHQRGLPLYAECGGLMYLVQELVDAQGVKHEMVGLLPGRCVMGQRVMLGYRIVRASGDSWFLKDGETVRGHEFHYSLWERRPGDLPPAYLLLPRSGHGEPLPEGARVGNLWASYVHVHFAAMPALATRFVEACQRAMGGGP